MENEFIEEAILADDDDDEEVRGKREISIISFGILVGTNQEA